MVACEPHKLKVAGSIPASATKLGEKMRTDEQDERIELEQIINKTVAFAEELRALSNYGIMSMRLIGLGLEFDGLHKYNELEKRLLDEFIRILQEYRQGKK